MMRRLTSKIPTFDVNLQSKITNFIKRTERITPERKKRLVISAVVFFMANLAYSLFSLYSLLSFGFMIAGIYIYLKINFNEIKKKGLINYLPLKHQKMLLQRSLFDVLCDMWFIPKLSVYLKAVISPFFIKIDPTEAINQFKDLPHGTRKAILTKGVINILPIFAKNALLPDNELVTEESETSSRAEELPENLDNEDTIQLTLQNTQEKPKGNILDSDESNKIEHRIKQSLSMEKLKGLESRVSQISTDDDSLVNHNFSLSRQMEVKKTFPSFTEVNPMRVHLDYYDRSKEVYIKHSQIRTRNRNFEARIRPKVEKKFLHDSESSDLRSEVLNSSKTSAKKIKEKMEVSETWDKLELFVKKHREKLLKQKLNSNGPSKKVEFKGALQTLQNIASLLSKEGLMNKLEDKKLMKIFLISSAALLLQFSISKKTRYWCYNTLNILMYATGFALSTGSMAILAIKLKERYRKWKDARKLEIIQEVAQKEDEKENENDE